MHFKVKDWKTGWTGESVMWRVDAIKRSTDAFTNWQAGEHNPEVMIVIPVDRTVRCTRHSLSKQSSSMPSPAGLLQLLRWTSCTGYRLPVAYSGC